MKQRSSPTQRVLAVAGLPLLVLLLLLLLVASCTCCDAARAPPTATTPPPTPPMFGPLVTTFATIDSYQRKLSYSSSPLVLFLFEHDPKAVAGFWQPLITGFAAAMERFGVDVADVDTPSEVGQQLQQAIGRNTAILFFQGVGDTPVDGEKGLKVPMAYEGAPDLLSLTKWVLYCISASVVQRVHSDADLARFFALYPQYPSLPRVLFFPAVNFTHAGFLSVSQRFSYDAGFAVVPDAFDSAETTAIAQRYGIASVAELPVLLVLHKATPEEAGGDEDSDLVVRLNGTATEWSYAGVSDFLAAQIPDTIEALVAKAEATRDGRVLAQAERRRTYMAAALVERQQHVVDEERQQMAVEPVVVADQAAWEKHCLHIPKGHKCVVAFVDSTIQPTAQASAVQVLSIVSLKLMEMLAMESHSIALVVVEREGSAALRDYFEAGQNGYPDVVLLSLARPAKYYNFVGSFSAESILHFLSTHDPRLGAEEMRGGHAFIPRMVPKLESPAVEGSASDDADDGGDL